MNGAPVVFSGMGIGQMVRAIAALESDEETRLRSAIFSGMDYERRCLQDPRDTIEEIKFIIDDMTEDELGDFNEWADVQRVELIRNALKELEEKEAA